MINRITLRAWLWSLVAAVSMAICVFHLVRGLPLQTDLLALLPPTERDPAAERAVEALNAVVGQRVLFVVSHPDEAAARAATAIFARALEEGGFDQVRARLPTLDAEIFTRHYGPHRFGLLTDADRGMLASGRFDPEAAALERLLLPMAGGIAAPLADDPFGFFSHWLSERVNIGHNLALEDGFLVARENGRLHCLVMAQVAGSPFANDEQDAAMETYASARAQMRQRFPDAQVMRTGTVFYAAAARVQAQQDVDRIGLGTILGIALMLYLVYRSAWPLLLGLLSVAIGVSVATSVILLTQGEVHLITLAFGASLIGEAIDYSIQYFSVHQDAGPNWQPERGKAMVRPALTIAVATSLLSYGALGLLQFPAISQIALFALVGLTAAYLSVLWLLPALLTRPSRRDPVRATAWAGHLLKGWCGMLSGRRALWFAGLALLCSLPGWMAVTVDDDVRQLIDRPADLVQDESDIRRLTGYDGGNRFFLVRGADAEQVLEREAELVRRLRPLVGARALSGYQAISDLVPPKRMQESDTALIGRVVLGNPQALSAALEAAGYRPEVVSKLAKDHEHSTPLRVEDWLRFPFVAPWRHLWSPLGENQPASIVTIAGDRQPALLAEATAGLSGVVLVDKLGSVSDLLKRYRTYGGPVLLAMASVIYLVLTYRYGPRAAAHVMTPVVLGEILSVGVFGYVGEAVTLFAMLGWGLTLGIGVNYAIFLREGAGRAPAAAAGVLLSAATTLLAFGLLALSGMPALRQFGLALLTGIAAAVFFAPLAMASRSRT